MTKATIIFIVKPFGRTIPPTTQTLSNQKNMKIYSFLLLFILQLPFSTPTIEKQPSYDIQYEMLEEVNSLRARGCTCGSSYMPKAPALVWDENLEKAAKKHTRDMYVNKFFSHTGSDGSRSRTRIERYTTKYFRWAENIHRSSYLSNVKNVVNSWKDSPGHCRNMMNKKYTAMGAANYGGYWTQTFGGY